MADETPDLTTAEQQLAASKRQFGANAANYAISGVHAKGASLDRIVELVAPQSDWVALDVASAAGHTAFAFAPHVESVVSSDATPEMLAVAEKLATERGIDNVSFEEADAQNLPFADESFDLVTCRIAPHHFSDPGQFVHEVARVLRPHGVFGLVDNVSPEDSDDATWCNEFERRRDPSHLRCLPMSEWIELLGAAGLESVTAETMGKKMDFKTWADNMSVDLTTRTQLLEDLANAPAGARDWLQPSLADPPSFVLTEGLFTAAKEATSRG